MINEIVRRVKARLGTRVRRLELDDDQIVDCLQQETLRTLSIYNPYFVEYTLELSKDNKVDGSDNMFYVPEIIADQFEVMGIEKVYSSSMFTPGNYSILGSTPLSTLNNFVDMLQTVNYQQAFLPPETFSYIQPNILRLYFNGMSNATTLVLRTTHAKDFSTFPFGMRETIMNLALYDVALDIFAERRFFANITTPLAEINLDIDYLNMEDKRSELIETMRKNQLKTSGTKKIYLV
jgi:hypothetical protein